MHRCASLSLVLPEPVACLPTCLPVPALIVGRKAARERIAVCAVCDRLRRLNFQLAATEIEGASNHLHFCLGSHNFESTSDCHRLALFAMRHSET